MAATGLVTARLAGVAVRVCDDDHVTVVDDDLAARLVAAMDTQLVGATRRRLRRDDVCGVCRAPLTLPGRTTETPVVDDTGPSVVTLSPTMEMVRCPSCGAEQLPTEVAGALRDLLPTLVATIEAPPGQR